MDRNSASRAPVSLLIAFLDLSRFSAQTRRLDDAALAEVVDEFYERVAAAVTGAGGRVVKFMGDAALVVFPADHADDGVGMLLGLKGEIDDWLASIGWECRLAVRAHVGTVMAGAYGGAGDKRFDVIGSEVNTAAMLEGGGVSLSVAAFRQLGRELRTRFKKHTAPVTYIRVEDPHRLRLDKR
jgi:class 3 adenylate cyclase